MKNLLVILLSVLVLFGCSNEGSLTETAEEIISSSITLNENSN